MNRTFLRLFQIASGGVAAFGAASLGCALLCLEPAHADPRLRKGMSLPDVVKILGAPLDRTEFESRREESWRFEKYTATFHEGRLKSWSIGGGAPALSASAPPASAADSAVVLDEAKKRRTEELAFPVEEILTEIMKEGPSKDAGDVPPLPPGLPVNPMAPVPEVSQ